MVGSALVRRLGSEDCRLLAVDRADLDLRRQAAVEAWMADARPDVVIMAAARVGGILANRNRPADFIADNLAIALNMISAAAALPVERLCFLGSSCVYPREAAQPIVEAALMTGPLEPTNAPYAVAKIAGIELARAYRRQTGADFFSVMPTNLYGPGDNFDPVSSHVLPALIRKVHEAKLRGERRIVVWGTGTPLREFLHVDDCADAIVLLLERYDGDGPVNIGAGRDIAIAELARLVAEVVGFDGEIVFDASKPDGTPRKLLDVGTLAGLGWAPRIRLRDGIAATYRWFLANVADDRSFEPAEAAQ